jgi:hypothetical protein
VYDPSQILAIFERLLNKTLNAVCDDKVRELTEEGKEVPKVKPTLEELDPTRIDTLMTELPYETLIKYFTFVWKNHPSNKSIQEDVT